jgi:hypothetical protein
MVSYPKHHGNVILKSALFMSDFISFKGGHNGR